MGFQRENTWLFKGEFWPEISGRLMRSWGGIGGHDRGDDRGLHFASNEAMIVLDRGHDRAAIGPQLHVDQGSS